MKLGKREGSVKELTGASSSDRRASRRPAGGSYRHVDFKESTDMFMGKIHQQLELTTEQQRLLDVRNED